MNRLPFLLLLTACDAVEAPTHDAQTLASDRAKVDLSSEELALLPADNDTLAELGARAGAAGDIDADGLMDVILGAPGDSALGSQAGAAYVLYGSTSAPLSDEQVLRASDGKAQDRFGDAVAGAGDVDGDGYDDVLVGAWGDSKEATDGGAAWLWYGSTTGLQGAQKITATEPGTFDYFGYALDGAGDVDGDGYDDLIVGAGLSRTGATGGGKAFLFFGSTSGVIQDEDITQELWPSDIANYDRFGQAIAGAGDLDGDGLSDVVVGARTADPAGASGAGAVYTYLGSSEGLDLGSETKLTASTPTASAGLGSAVASAGDVDGDGYDDLILGAPGGAGEAWIFHGSAKGATSTDALRLSLTSGGSTDAFGSSVAGLGDLDGDGYDEVAVGSPGSTSTVTAEGAVHVYYGSPTGIASNTRQDLSASSPSAGDGLGASVVGLGDVDGDGFPDLLGGAPDRYQASLGEATGGATAWLNGCVDGDGDGACASVDCDDDDAGVGAGKIWYVDSDGDGYGDPTTASASISCSGPTGQVSTGGDCDDNDPDLSPGATEIVGDGIDQDCDGYETCYADADGDGVRALDGSTVLSSDSDCSDAGEAITSSPATDCDDTDPDVRPGADEVVGDGVDQDCDGKEICYADKDDDGYRPDETSTVSSSDDDCDDPGEALWDEPVGDCNDNEPTAYDGSMEIPGDEIDQDCDGREVCYLDADDDGFLAEGKPTLASEDLDCTDLGEGLDNDPGNDCDDNREGTHPGAEEICNGVDDDCDGFVDGTEATGFGIWERDEDGDGYTVPSSTASGCEPPPGYARPSEAKDCNDVDASVHPGAEEIAGDGRDQDCDQQDLKGCGCASSPAPASGLGGLALLFLGAILRRRRT